LEGDAHTLLLQLVTQIIVWHCNDLSTWLQHNVCQRGQTVH
jgi:hypothetical protein